jgi:putative transcription factor
MECEICGKETLKTKTIELNGADYIVCLGCAHLGRELTPRKTVSENLIQLKKKSFSSLKGMKPERHSFNEETQLIENLGAVIKREREKKGLTVKELAMKLFEKESVMHRVESGRFEPSNELVKKLEKFFEINLRKKVEEGKEFESKQFFKKMTLADLLEKKK